MKQRYFLYVFPLLLCCLSCQNKKILPVSKSVYNADKLQIAKFFIEKVEYYRLYSNYERYHIPTYPPKEYEAKVKQIEDHYKKYPYAKYDPANFFEPYACRYSLIKDRYVNSPLPTASQLEVITDTIVYSKNLLLCFAFLVVHNKYNSINGLEDDRNKGREYDANAVIGCRSSLKDPFEIYPPYQFNVTGFASYEDALKISKNLFFKKLVKGGSGSPIFSGMHFKQNVGDEDFFEKSPFFRKTRQGFYYFQLYEEPLTCKIKEYPSRQIHEFMSKSSSINLHAVHKIK